MSSIYDPGNRPPGDLTARARIRDAAMAQFAERGFNGATIRGIADAAGVSTGLVQHHFGSKEGLRRACDEAVVEITQQELQALESMQGGVTTPDVMAALYDRGELLVPYLLRLLLDGSPAAATLFDEFAVFVEKYLSDFAPEVFPPGSRKTRDGATLMLAMHFGPAILHEHVSRRTGATFPDRTTAPRLGLVILDIYTAMGHWLASDTGRQTRAAIEKYLETLAAADTDGGSRLE